MAIIIEKDYSETEIADCRVLYDTLVRAHENCAGAGMIVSKGAVRDCDCELVYRFVRELIYARVPRRFWGIPWDDVALLRECLDTSQDMEVWEKLRADGYTESCMIYGLSGSGKTALLSRLAHEYIATHRHTGIVCYITADEIIEFSRKDELKIYLDRMSGANVVLIDELTKCSRTDWALMQLDGWLRKLYDNGAVLYITCSDDLDSIAKTCGVHLSSFVRKISQSVVVNYHGKSAFSVLQGSSALLGSTQLVHAAREFSQSSR